MSPLSSAEGTTGTTEETSEEAVEQETDERREALLTRLRDALGEGVVDSHIVPGDDMWVRVATDRWREAAEVCRDLGFDYFCFLSAIDWMPSPFGRGEKEPDEAGDAGGEDSAAEEAAVRSGGEDPDVELDRGYTGGETRIQVLARLYSTGQKMGVNLKTDVPDDTSTVPSWTPVYAGSDWHERETWEMFGIEFAGHPNLRHIYLPTEFEGYPLRKDFPLLSREVKPWPGIVDVEPLPGEDEGGTEGDGGGGQS